MAAPKLKREVTQEEDVDDASSVVAASGADALK